MKVVALTDSCNPWHSFWIRFGQYAPLLPLPVQISSDASVLAQLQPGDALLLYRYSLQWGELAPQLAALRTRGVRLLADVDDDLWQAPGWPMPRIGAYTRALQQCQLISCSTPALQELLQVMFRRQRLTLLRNSAPPLQPRQPMGGPLRLCWTGAPWTRPQDLSLLRPLAQWICEQGLAVRWRHIGHAPGRLSFAEALGLPAAAVETVPLLPHCDYLKALGGDIGLAPLAPGLFNSFKSELKLLEFSSVAMPWIASASPPYEELCTRWGWAGRLCTTPRDWIEQLQALLDPARRQREGLALQHLSQSRQSQQQAAQQWHQLLRHCCSH